MFSVVILKKLYQTLLESSHYRLPDPRAPVQSQDSMSALVEDLGGFYNNSTSPVVCRPVSFRKSITAPLCSLLPSRIPEVVISILSRVIPGVIAPLELTYTISNH